MRRREFITALGGAAAWPLVARAQQQKRFRIGMLETISPALNAAHLDAFRDGLRELGYVEGQNYTIEYRSADGRADRFPDLAAELVRLGVDLIVVRGTPAAMAAKTATGTIPVVMSSVGDPLLIVDSLARPGRNVTGLSAFVNEMANKRLELIRELVPAMSRIALFANMSNPVSLSQWEDTKTAARTLGLQAELLDVRSLGEWAAHSKPQSENASTRSRWRSTVCSRLRLERSPSWRCATGCRPSMSDGSSSRREA